MPKFNIGDRVKVPEGMRGAKLEWLGKEGTVKALAGSIASGTSPRVSGQGLGPWQPMYEVQFDSATDPELVDEGMLVSVT